MVLLNKKCRVSGSIGLPFELVKSCSVPIVHITALPIEFVLPLKNVHIMYYVHIMAMAKMFIFALHNRRAYYAVRR